MDTTWIYVLFWLVEAALCGIVASNKGRNVPLWVILGLVAGFFALIVYDTNGSTADELYV